MDFALSANAEEVSARMLAFMREEVFPAETEYAQWRANNDPHAHPPVLEKLKASAQSSENEPVCSKTQFCTSILFQPLTAYEP